MQNPQPGIFVIALAGHSGSGKSTAARGLAARLGQAPVLQLDYYAESSTYPPAASWLAAGADPNAFSTPRLAADLRALREGRAISHPVSGEIIQPGRFLVLEEPFGRARAELRDQIDFLALIDVPLEIALTRKILRKSDWLPWEDDPALFMDHLRENLGWYQRIGRDFYLAVQSLASQNCDLIVDGLLPPSEVVETIYRAIQLRV